MLVDYIVSLFTREWIEIFFTSSYFFQRAVSLFTREWIEICARVRGFGIGTSSPSLRGSGLKCPGDYLLEKDAKVSLFTREWIEIVSLEEV